MDLNPYLQSVKFDRGGFSEAIVGCKDDCVISESPWSLLHDPFLVTQARELHGVQVVLQRPDLHLLGKVPSHTHVLEKSKLDASLVHVNPSYGHPACHLLRQSFLLFNYYVVKVLLRQT